MSLSTKRAEIASALNDITVLKGYETEPSAKKTGDSWPQFAGKTYPVGEYPTPVWKVFVVLPQDEKKAIEFVESNLDDIHDGLEFIDNPVGYIDSILTVDLGNTNSPVFGLEITLRS